MAGSQQLIEAITKRLVLSVRYGGYQRVIEPHAYGQGSKGESLLRCWQVSSQKPGSSPGWRLMEAADVAVIGPIGAVFSSARPGYRRGDTAMTHIYAQV